MTKSEKHEVKVSRSYDEPLEKLWKAWTDPEHFARWYGPKGFTVPTCEIDLKVGGRHLWSMKSADGREMYYSGVYKEIRPMERLVYSDGPSDPDGNPTPPSELGMPAGTPKAMDVTVSFDRQGDKTLVTVSHVGREEDDPASRGWEQALDKLAASLQEL